MSTRPAEYDLDTGMFSAHQLHPEAAIRYACNTAWLTLRGRGLHAMITKHHTGLVVVGNEVNYLRPLTFFTTSHLNSVGTVRLRDDGRLVVFDIQHRVGDQDAVAVRVTTRPVKLSGGPAMDAAPAAADEGVRALFDPAEIVPTDTVPSRHLQRMVEAVTAGAEQIASGAAPVFIGRNDCELADQWLHARLPALVATAREQLLMTGVSGLAACVERPITRYHGEFFRPMYFGDQGVVRVTAYRREGTVYAVYQVLGSLPPGAAEDQRRLSALALEVFE